jgi:MFS family permease
VITNDFNSLSDAGWYGAVYLLMATAFQPTFGKIYQIFNVKYVYISVMSLFFLGSLVSAVAQSSAVFIMGRAIAGLATGGAFSGGLTIIAYSVPVERRAVFTGALGAIFGVSPNPDPVINV